MSDILQRILARKRTEVDAARALVSAEQMAAAADASVEPRRGFRRALAEAEAPAIIAELKRRSPSKGEIRPGFEPVACAKAYAEGGATALSVLTDEEGFGGKLEYLQCVRDAVSLPLLRKDFTVDTYQIDEARVAGADAILLIVSALEAGTLARFHAHARARGLDCLVEVHDEDELETALGLDCVDLIGVNNRNLATIEVDLGTTERLARGIPAEREVLLVAESGIRVQADLTRLTQAGAGAFLVGESLMREPNVAEALIQLRLGDRS